MSLVPWQVELAMAVVMSASKTTTFAAEMPIKRLLMLLELARQGDESGIVRTDRISLNRWKQVCTPGAKVG